MFSVFAFWGILAGLICLALSSRLLHRRRERNSSRTLAILDVAVRCLGLIVLALFLFGLAFAVFVGFPE